jgi:hypothetical protein
LLDVFVGLTAIESRRGWKRDVGRSYLESGVIYLNGMEDSSEVTVHTPDVQAASLAGILGRDEPFRAAAMRLRPYVQGSTPRLRQVSMTLRPAA